MEKELNMVKGAVSKHDLLPVLKSLHAYDKRIQASNGRLIIDCPFDYGLNFTVNATNFINAIENSSNRRTIKIEKHRMIIKDNHFIVRLPLFENDIFPRKKPTGKKHKISKELLSIITILRPFISADALREWSNGILLKDDFAYVTNNAVLIRIPFKFKGVINIPTYVIDELIRIGKTPTYLSIGKNDLTFFLDNETWISGLQLSIDWPDHIDELIQGIKKAPKLPVGVNRAMEKLSYFVGDLIEVRLSADGLTVGSEGNIDNAVVKEFKFKESAFNFEFLKQIFKVATHFNETLYPKPCYFYNDKTKLKGVIVGIKII